MQECMQTATNLVLDVCLLCLCDLLGGSIQLLVLGPDLAVASLALLGQTGVVSL